MYESNLWIMLVIFSDEIMSGMLMVLICICNQNK